MHPTRALLFAAILAAPAALATWNPPLGAHAEPSTPHDDPAYMWVDPDSSGTKLYFAGDLAPVSGEPSARRFVAWLGYWTDCNDDGYVGMVADPEYPSLLLQAAQLARCPNGGPNNQGGTVREFLWLGPGSHDVDDPGAQVWVDWGLPGASVPAGFALKNGADEVLVFDPTAQGPKWKGATVWGSSTYGDWRPGESTHYATVSGAHFSGTPGAVGTYGAGACPGSVSGWQCDRSFWMGPVKVGDAYRLRDVDCHDLAQPGGMC